MLPQNEENISQHNFFLLIKVSNLMFCFLYTLMYNMCALIVASFEMCIHLHYIYILKLLKQSKNYYTSIAYIYVETFMWKLNKQVKLFRARSISNKCAMQSCRYHRHRPGKKVTHVFNKIVYVIYLLMAFICSYIF